MELFNFRATMMCCNYSERSNCNQNTCIKKYAIYRRCNSVNLNVSNCSYLSVSDINKKANFGKEKHKKHTQKTASITLAIRIRIKLNLKWH